MTARPALARCTGAPPASAHRLASPACQPSPTFGGEGPPRIFLGTCLCRHARRRRRARHAAAIRPDRRRARPAPRPRRHLGGRRRHRRRADGAGPRRTWPRPRRPFPWRRHVGPGRARVRPAFPVTKGQTGWAAVGCACAEKVWGYRRLRCPVGERWLSAICAGWVARCLWACVRLPRRACEAIRVECARVCAAGGTGRSRTEHTKQVKINRSSDFSSDVTRGRFTARAVTAIRICPGATP